MPRLLGSLIGLTGSDISQDVIVSTSLEAFLDVCFYELVGLLRDETLRLQFPEC
jgi:hypothetical protein